MGNNKEEKKIKNNSGKIVCIDFDNTCTIGDSTWGAILKEICGRDVDKKNGKFMQALKDLIALSANDVLEIDMINSMFVKILKQFHVNKDLVERASKNIELANNFSETIRALHEDGYKIFIISGGIKNVIMSTLGDDAKYFTKIYGAEIEFGENGEVDEFHAADFDNSGKAILVKNIMKRSGVDSSNMYYVGDGVNDLSVTKLEINTIGVNIDTDTKRNMRWGQKIHTVKDDFGKLLEVIPLTRGRAKE